MMGTGFEFGGLGMIIFWAVILVGAAYFIKYLVTQDKPRRELSAPMEILKTRFASGEISKEEYKQLKNDLMRI